MRPGPFQFTITLENATRTRGHLRYRRPASRQTSWPGSTPFAPRLAGINRPLEGRTVRRPPRADGPTPVRCRGHRWPFAGSDRLSAPAAVRESDYGAVSGGCSGAGARTHHRPWRRGYGSATPSISPSSHSRSSDAALHACFAGRFARGAACSARFATPETWQYQRFLANPDPIRAERRPRMCTRRCSPAPTARPETRAHRRPFRASPTALVHRRSCAPRLRSRRPLGAPRQKGSGAGDCRPRWGVALGAFAPGYGPK